MKRGMRSPLVILLAGLAVIGTSIYAFAGWTTSTGTPVSLKVRVADMPVGNTPSVEQGKHSAVRRWAPDRIVAGVPVESYVVTRHGNGRSVDVCTVTKAACRDTQIPAGEWTWTVRPRFKNWIGVASPPTAVFTYVGDPPAVAETVDSLVVDPEPATSSTTSSPPTPEADPEPSATMSSSPVKEAEPVPSQATTSAPAPAKTTPSASAGEGGGEGEGADEDETTVGAPAGAEEVK